MLNQNKSDGYLGNPKVKRDGVVRTYSHADVQEYIRCSQDPVYFTEKYMRVIHPDRGLVSFKLYDYQKKMIDHFNDNRFSIVLSCRQSGKTASTTAYLLWKALFFPEETIIILANKGSTAKEILGRITLALENVPFFLQPGCKELNKMSITFSNNTRLIAAATSSNSVRGLSASCVTGDTIVCVEINNDYYYTSIENASYINKYKSEFVEENVKEFYTVYKITNNITNKEYIGYHATNNLEDGYMGSGKLIGRAIEKYGPDNFTKEYIEIFDNKEDAVLLEKLLVDLDYVNRRDTYNISLGGNDTILFGENNGFYGKKHTDETKLKISKKSSVKKHTVESKKKISAGSKKHWQNEEYREKIRSKLIGRTFSEETRQKLSDALKGRNHTEEAIKLMSERVRARFENMSPEEREIWYNKVFTEDANKKRSESLTGQPHPWQDKINKNPEKIRKSAEKHRGMKRSAETRLKQSIAAKNRPIHNKGKIYCYNPETLEKSLCFIEDMPKGWKRGFVKK